MPIYEYQCETCGKETEVLQKFSDAPLVNCPACDGHMEKLMSKNSFQLKGSGWYVTDYKNKNNDADPTVSSTKDAAPVAEKASTEKASTEKAPAEKAPAKESSVKEAPAKEAPAKAAAAKGVPASS